MKRRNNLKIKDIKKVTDYRHLNMFEIDYTDRFQEEKVWQVASRQSEPRCASGDFDIPDAVVIVPFHTKYNKLVIIEEFRVPLGGNQFGFPAGLVDEGESISEAAERELFEETGLKMTRFLGASQPLYTSSGMSDESIVMAYVECQGEPSDEANEGSEEITTQMITREEAVELCSRQDAKIDVKTWLVLKGFGNTGVV